MADLRPVQDRVLVRMTGEMVSETKGGILIPETSRDLPQEGEVVAVGNGKIKKGRRVPVDLSVGDKVLVSYYAGTDIRINGEHLLVIREADILGKVD